MKKQLLIVLVLTAAAAFAALGDIVSSFTIAGLTTTRGLARSGSYLYVSNWYSPYNIYRVNPTTGSVYGSYPGTTPYSNTEGLAYAGNNRLYGTRLLGSMTPAVVYEMNDTTGSVYRSFNTVPTVSLYGLASRCTGDGGAGTDALFLADMGASGAGERVYVYTTAGSRISSFALPTTTNFLEIAYDWRNHIVWGGMSDHVIHGVNTAGSIVSSFSVSPGAWSYGMTYYGGYLWVGVSGSIYKIHCPSTNPAVAPSSLGRVKAFYR